MKSILFRNLPDIQSNWLPLIKMLACLATGVAIIVGCAAETYTVGSARTPHTTYGAAYKKLIQQLEGASWVESPGIFGPKMHGTCTGIQISGDGFSFYAAPKAGNAEGAIHSFLFAEVPTKIGGGGYDATHVVWFGDDVFLAVSNTHEFLDAVSELLYQSSDAILNADNANFATFRDEATSWRSQRVTPALPEEVQQYRALAEDAIQQKSFFEAIDYYENGLAIAPLWPEGQFNVAMLYGELKVYGQAALHMKRYLELNPTAEEAIAARDKIRVWTAKAHQASSSKLQEHSGRGNIK
ncbi:MAG: hypothetical protein HYZ01_13555 [Ignavibacteriales bacterium]|nr:hypothetical protein [Ignavibacteriales bacterium]